METNISFGQLEEQIKFLKESNKEYFKDVVIRYYDIRTIVWNEFVKNNSIEPLLSGIAEDFFDIDQFESTKLQEKVFFVRDVYIDGNLHKKLRKKCYTGFVKKIILNVVRPHGFGYYYLPEEHDVLWLRL